MTRQKPMGHTASDQRRAPRVLPGRTLHKANVRFSDEAIEFTVGLLDESLDGIAVQTRQAGSFLIGRVVEVAVDAAWRSATVVRVSRRGPGYRVGLEWCAKQVELLPVAE